MFSANLRTSSRPSGRISQSGLLCWMKPLTSWRRISGRYSPNLRAVEVEQHGAVAHLLVGHLVEHLGGGRELLAQSLGEAAVDAAVLVLVGDGEREDFLLGQIGKTFHNGLMGEFGRGSSYIGIYSKQGRASWRQVAGRRDASGDGEADMLERLRRTLPIQPRCMHVYWRFARGLTFGVRGAGARRARAACSWSSTAMPTAGICPAAGSRRARRCSRRWRANCARRAISS